VFVLAKEVQLLAVDRLDSAPGLQRPETDARHIESRRVQAGDFSKTEGKGLVAKRSNPVESGFLPQDTLNNLGQSGVCSTCSCDLRFIGARAPNATCNTTARH